MLIYDQVELVLVWGFVMAFYWGSVLINSMSSVVLRMEYKKIFARVQV